MDAILNLFLHKDNTVKLEWKLNNSDDAMQVYLELSKSAKTGQIIIGLDKPPLQTKE